MDKDNPIYGQYLSGYLLCKYFFLTDLFCPFNISLLQKVILYIMRKHIKTHISQIFNEMDESIEEESYSLSSGYNSIDEITQGIQTKKSYFISNDDYNISSEFIHNLAINIATDKNVVLFINLFECATITAKRFKVIAKSKGINMEALNKLPLFIENEIPNFEVIIERVMNFVRFTHVKVLMISSIEQIMSGYDIKDYEYKKRGIGKLLSIAKEFNIAIIIGHGVSQYNSCYSYLVNNADWALKLNKAKSYTYYISYRHEREPLDQKTWLNYDFPTYDFTDSTETSHHAIEENHEVKPKTQPKPSKVIPTTELIRAYKPIDSEGELCPVCSSKLIFTEGCKKCINCEYSACGT